MNTIYHFTTIFLHSCLLIKQYIKFFVFNDVKLSSFHIIVKLLLSLFLSQSKVDMHFKIITSYQF